jgi:hypothetical protein
MSETVFQQVTPALLRLDPICEPLRGDPAFYKLCQESPLAVILA